MKWNTIALIFLIVTLPLLIILASARILIFNEGYYHAQFVKHHVYEKMPDASNILHETVLYFKGKQALDVPEFTQNEKSHMHDVKILINKLLILYYLILLADGVLILYLIRTKQIKRFSKACRASGLIVIFCSALAYAFRNSFSSFFVGFHTIFFPEGNWSFPESSALIQIFPEQFFINFTFDTAKNALFISTFLILAGVLAFVINQEKK
jgi:integral membrane protein (TIGR01906 family)